MHLSTQAELIGGAGEGLVKILKSAEEGATSAIIIAVVFFVYSAIVAVLMTRMWLRHDPQRGQWHLLKRLLPMGIGLFFALFVAIEICRRMLT